MSHVPLSLSQTLKLMSWSRALSENLSLIQDQDNWRLDPGLRVKPCHGITGKLESKRKRF